MSIRRRALTGAFLFGALLLAAPRARAEGGSGGFFKTVSFMVASSSGPVSWVNVPSVSIEPYTGLTAGLLSVWARADRNEVRHIFAPSFTHNPLFGWTTSARYYYYPSRATHLYAVASLSERTDQQAFLRYTHVETCAHELAYHAEFNHEVAGAQRFYGFGSASPKGAESDYTLDQTVALA